MKSYVRDSIGTEKNQEKLKRDQRTKVIFLLAALPSPSMTAIIVIFISVKGTSLFLSGCPYGQQDIVPFLAGMIWRKDQGTYGANFTVTSTLVLAFDALAISSPLSVPMALFTTKITPKRVAEVITTVVKPLAGIPSVVYDIFAFGATTALVSSFVSSLGFATAGGNSLLAIIPLLAVMTFPTITSLLITTIRSVGREVELGSLALDAMRTRTNFEVTLTSVKSGTFAGTILDIGRVFGGATVVAMVAGNKMSGSTVDTFDTTGTLITIMLAGLKETTGLDYDIRFSADLMLMAVILLSSLPLNLMKKKVGNMK